MWYSVWICVNLCHIVSFCVYSLCVLCVLCVFVRISASRIAGCVFPRPKLRYSSASRMSYLLRCQFWGVQLGGCVYTYVFGGVSIWGYSVSICVNCVYSCVYCVYSCVYCVYLYVFWCGIVWIPVQMCEMLCFVSLFVNSMGMHRMHQYEAVEFWIWMFFLFFEFCLNFRCMYVFFWFFFLFWLIFVDLNWFWLILIDLNWRFLWISIDWCELNGFLGSENEWKTLFFRWVSKCLKMSKKWVLGYLGGYPCFWWFSLISWILWILMILWTFEFDFEWLNGMNEWFDLIWFDFVLFCFVFRLKNFFLNRSVDVDVWCCWNL